MVSKAWLNLLLWGLGERLEKRNDYRTDILMIVNMMNWYSVLILSGSYGGFPTFWVTSIVLLPASWIGTQLIVGYVLVRRARRVRAQKLDSVKGPAASRPTGGSESEEEP